MRNTSLAVWTGAAKTCCTDCGFTSAPNSPAVTWKAVCRNWGALLRCGQPEATGVGAYASCDCAPQRTPPVRCGSPFCQRRTLFAVGRLLGTVPGFHAGSVMASKISETCLLEAVWPKGGLSKTGTCTTCKLASRKPS